MKSHLTIALTAGFAGWIAGFAMAWKREEVPAESSYVTPGSTNRSSSVVAEDARSKFPPSAGTVPPADAVPPHAFPDRISELSKPAGIRGLGRAHKEEIQQLLNRWHEAAPAEVLDWLGKQPLPANRQFYLECLLPRIAAEDIRQAVELMERHFTREAPSVEIPHDLLSRALATDPQLMVRAWACTWCDAEVASGWNVEVPEGLDFPGLFARMAEVIESMDPGLSQGTYPANLLETWCRRDAQAAFEWVRSTGNAEWKSRASGVSLDAFFQAYAATETPAAYGDFVAQVVRTEADPEAAAQMGWRALAGKGDSTATEAYLHALTDDRSRAAALEALIRASNSSRGPTASALRNDLFSRLPPERRRDFLARSAAESGLDDEVFREMQETQRLLER